MRDEIVLKSTFLFHEPWKVTEYLKGQMDKRILVIVDFFYGIYDELLWIRQKRIVLWDLNGRFDSIHIVYYISCRPWLIYNIYLCMCSFGYSTQYLWWKNLCFFRTKVSLHLCWVGFNDMNVYLCAWFWFAMDNINFYHNW